MTWERFTAWKGHVVWAVRINRFGEIAFHPSACGLKAGDTVSLWVNREGGEIGLKRDANGVPLRKRHNGERLLMRAKALCVEAGLLPVRETRTFRGRREGDMFVFGREGGQ